MKNVRFFTLALILIMSLASCKKDDPTPVPSSDFTMTVVYADGRVPLKINFVATALAGVYEWDLGNGQTASTRDFSYTYTTAGSYTVKLKVTTSAGTTTTTKSLQVKPAFGKCYVKQVQLQAFPTSDNGASWDASGGAPDVFFNILSPNPTNAVLLDGRSGKFDNLAAVPVAFNFTNPGYLVPTNADFYFFAFYDEDALGDTSMGAVSFKVDNYRLESSVSRYPTTTTLTQSGFTLGVTLDWQE